MSDEKQKLTRQEVAAREVGRTTITRPMCWVLAAAFVATIFLVPISQYVHDMTGAAEGDPGRAQLRMHSILGMLARSAG